MTPERRRQIEELFEAALDLGDAERAHFVDVHCAGDAELRAEVNSLLRAHDRDEGVLDGAAPGVASSPPERPPAYGWGDLIGPYRLHRELGRGGMGVVYFAERDDGQFRRQVALKLLRDPDPRLSARIIGERQILASLQHPNIAALLDGGAAPDGRPYLVVEYVNGLPIDVYCDRMRLSIANRVRLFISVARAIDYAHRNLIIHRDLKPSNILVTTDGQVKLLDFGIAKLLNPTLGRGELALTQPDQRALTPEYASPEQVRGEPLSTSSDVYSLGVVLYELLTGHQPYRLEGCTTPEMLERVCETDPEPPSVRVLRMARKAHARGSERDITPAAIAQARATTTERLRRSLQGDLDAIVMMALRKEPGGRYGSAELLVEDLANHLDGRPVRALRGSRTYRFKKLVRRHRRAAVAATLVTVSLLSGATLAMWQARVAGLERDRAERALTEAEGALLQSNEVTTFLLGLFEAGDPNASPGLEITARDLVRRGVARADELADQPLVQARMLRVMGSVYESLGRYDEARDLTERALRTREAHPGTAEPEAAEMLVQLARIMRKRSAYDSAGALLARAADLQRRTLGPAHPKLAETLTWMLHIAVFLGDLEASERHAREALDILRSALGPDHTLVSNSLTSLGTILRRRGKIAEAEAMFREALTLRDRTGTAETLEGSADMLQLGALLRDETGELEEAEALHLRALEIRRRVVGGFHDELVWPLVSLGLLLADKGDHARAEPLLQEALALRQRAFGPAHPSVAETMYNMARFLRVAGRYREAESYLREALTQERELLGEDHARVAGSLLELGQLMIASGKGDEGLALMEEALARRNRIFGADNPGIGETLNLLGSAYTTVGRFAAADSALREALRILRLQYPDQHRHIRSAHSNLARLSEALGRDAEARRYRGLADLR
jgi:serine/threonine protein kinase/tetratricopeptide (TPR) repeat protein